MDICRSADLQIQMIGQVTDLTVPGTVVFDLPEKHAASFCVGDVSHRKIMLGGPVSCVGQFKCLGRTDGNIDL